MEGFEKKKSVLNHHLDDDDDQHKPEDHPQQEQLGQGFQHSPDSPSPPPPNPDPNLEPSSPPPENLDSKTVNEELDNQQCINGEVQEQQNVDEEFRNLVLEEKDVNVIEAESKDVGEGDEREERRERNADREVAVEDGDKNENEVVDEDEDEDSKEEDDRVVVDDDDGGDYRSEKEEGFEGSENVEGDSSSVSAVGLAMEGKYRRYHYPVRPDAEDCSYYIRNGSCKFGSNCKFNHPPKKRNQAAKEAVKEKEENAEKPGQIECKYYLRSGGCKNGKACRYNHTRGRTPIAPTLELNFLGLPIRLGEKECPYYMRNGSCKYGSACRFNHPNPTAVAGGDPAGYSNGISVPSQGASQSTMSSWSLPRTLKETAPFVPMMFSPTHGVPPANTEWNSYQAPVYPAPEGSLPTPPAFAMTIPVPETNFYAHHQQQMVVEEFPERPGQPECTYYMKTGDCKYRSGCKFHHPMSRISKGPPFALSDKGLPLRPDQNICTHYSRYGICKFGPACKFDHPVNFALSSSSGVSGPDHPPPYGNLVMAGRGRMGGTENGSKPVIQQRM